MCVQLAESQCEVQQRDRVIADLRLIRESERAVADQQSDNIVQSLKQKLAEYESAFGDVEGAASRSELTIVTLQQQATESRQRIIELESQLR